MTPVMIALLTITVVSVIAALRLHSALDKERTKNRRLRADKRNLNERLDLAESKRRIAERKLVDYRQTMKEQLRLDPEVAKAAEEVANWIEETEPEPTPEPPKSQVLWQGKQIDIPDFIRLRGPHIVPQPDGGPGATIDG